MKTLYHTSMSLHALLPLASQSVPHPLLIKFAAWFLIQAHQKRSSTDVSFHKPISQSHLLMIYGSSPLRVQPHPRRWWLSKKSSSQNSTATLLLMNTPRLLLIPWIFDMISYLVPISLTNAASHLIMKITKCNGWNTLFLLATLWNFFHSIITPLFSHHLNLN